MATSKFYALGCTWMLRDDWLDEMPPVSAPSNYKDPVKIKEYVDTARDKQCDQAATYPMALESAEVCLLELTLTQEAPGYTLRSVADTVGDAVNVLATNLPCTAFVFSPNHVCKSLAWLARRQLVEVPYWLWNPMSSLPYAEDSGFRVVDPLQWICRGLTETMPADRVLHNFLSTSVATLAGGTAVGLAEASTKLAKLCGLLEMDIQLCTINC